MKKGMSDDQELYELERRSREATIAGKTDFFERFASEDWVGIDPSGAVMTKQDALKNRQSSGMRFASIEVDDVKVRKYGDVAVVTGRSKVQGRHRGRQSSGYYRFTRVYAQKKGTWRVVSSHSTRIVPA